MNSILTLIITYFFKPCFETSAGDLRDQINESQILAADPRRFLLLSRHHIGRTARSF